jgi:predicted membrane-bound dolichyl-phosphate-mannose-protein mannosyltransferase
MAGLYTISYIAGFPLGEFSFYILTIIPLSAVTLRISSVIKPFLFPLPVIYVKESFKRQYARL